MNVRRCLRSQKCALPKRYSDEPDKRERKRTKRKTVESQSSAAPPKIFPWRRESIVDSEEMLVCGASNGIFSPHHCLGACAQPGCTARSFDVESVQLGQVDLHERSEPLQVSPHRLLTLTCNEYNSWEYSCLDSHTCTYWLLAATDRRHTSTSSQ